MSKERLEDIKTWLNRGFDLTEEDIEWLIEQAGRLQELEEELYGNDIQMGYKRMYGSCNRDYAKLLQQNKRYREALEFYAGGKHVAYKLDETDDDLVVDYGEIARKALEGEK